MRRRHLWAHNSFPFIKNAHAFYFYLLIITFIIYKHTCRFMTSQKKKKNTDSYFWSRKRLHPLMVVRWQLSCIDFLIIHYAKKKWLMHTQKGITSSSFYICIPHPSFAPACLRSCNILIALHHAHTPSSLLKALKGPIIYLSSTPHLSTQSSS